MKFIRLNSDTLSEKTIDQIKGLINKGMLKPGDRLPSERDLSLELGISRGILREALKTLESLGYLSRKPGGGTFVRDLADHDHDLVLFDLLKRATYFDYLEVRDVLEPKVVELAIERASDKELDDLENILRRFERSKAAFQISEPVLQFHYKLALTTKNIVLSNFMKANYEFQKNFAATVDIEEDIPRRKIVLSEHRAILAAIKARNRGKAILAVADHLKNARDYLDKKYGDLRLAR